GAAEGPQWRRNDWSFPRARDHDRWLNWSPPEWGSVCFQSPRRLNPHRQAFDVQTRPPLPEQANKQTEIEQPSAVASRCSPLGVFSHTSMLKQQAPAEACTTSVDM